MGTPQRVVQHFTRALFMSSLYSFDHHQSFQQLIPHPPSSCLQLFTSFGSGGKMQLISLFGNHHRSLVHFLHFVFFCFTWLGEGAVVRWRVSRSIQRLQARQSEWPRCHRGTDLSGPGVQYVDERFDLGVATVTIWFCSSRSACWSTWPDLPRPASTSGRGLSKLSVEG